jgi:hypothetical protein
MRRAGSSTTLADFELDSQITPPASRGDSRAKREEAMPNMATMREDRHSTNPVFNNHKLKLGTFQSNLDYGCLMSDVEGRLTISWPNTVALAKLGDEMEFEALVMAEAARRARRSALASLVKAAWCATS